MRTPLKMAVNNWLVLAAKTLMYRARRAELRVGVSVRELHKLVRHSTSDLNASDALICAHKAFECFQVPDGEVCSFSHWISQFKCK